MKKFWLGIALLCAGAMTPAVAFAADKLDAQPRIAVMSAFEPELKLLLGAVQNPATLERAGQRYATGKLAGQDVVLFLSGISMVNAAMATRKAIDAFEVKAIVFSGIAGGVDPSLAVGDVVVSAQWGAYLESVFARETPDGYKLPPFLHTERANFGMIFPRDTEVVRAGLAAPERRFWFPADAALLQTASKAAGKVNLERCAGASACLSHQPKAVLGGNGVSGPAFMDNAAFREFVFKTLHAQVLDMESAAAAQVAYSNGVPFIAFRSLSDLAGGGPGENEMGTFLALASGNSAKVVQAFLAELPAPAASAPIPTTPPLAETANTGACATLGGDAMLEARLFFGRNIGHRLGVSDRDWVQFVDKEVTPRFPDGLTVQNASGQWHDSDSGRLVREPSKVLTLLAPHNAATDGAIRAIVAAYKLRFRQQSVATVLRPACVGF
jgi:adenosylhomocysteine nucleosidase